MKRIIDLMRIDLMAFKGKKNVSFKLLVLFIIIFGIAFIFAGAFVSLIVLIVSIISCSLILNNEEVKGYRKTFGVVPADRKSVVIARFTLLTLITTIIGLAAFVIMTLTSDIDFYETVWTDGAYEQDSKLIDVAISPFINKTVARVIFGIIFMLSLMIMSSSLRKYYKNGYKQKKNATLKAVLKLIGGYIGFGVLCSVIVFTPLKKVVFPVISVIFSVLSGISKPFNGLLAMLLLVVIGYGFVVYRAVCAVVDYEKREL